MDYADAVVELEAAMERALFRANENGLSDKEVADEFRRFADRLEDVE